MFDDAGEAQARALLRELHQEVADVSRKIEIVDRRGRRHSARGQQCDRRQQSELRRDLYEVHRVIDNLHRRFPETLPAALRERQRAFASG